jgi:hypothetical protein
MGKEWNRIKKYENDFYVSERGRQRARGRQEAEILGRIAMSIPFMVGLIIIIAYQRWFIGLGLILITLFFIHLSKKRSRRR